MCNVRKYILLIYWNIKNVLFFKRDNYIFVFWSVILLFVKVDLFKIIEIGVKSIIMGERAGV